MSLSLLQSAVNPIFRRNIFKTNHISMSFQLHNPAVIQSADMFWYIFACFLLHNVLVYIQYEVSSSWAMTSHPKSMWIFVACWQSWCNAALRSRNKNTTLNLVCMKCYGADMVDICLLYIFIVVSYTNSTMYRRYKHTQVVVISHSLTFPRSSSRRAAVSATALRTAAPVTRGRCFQCSAELCLCQCCTYR